MTPLRFVKLKPLLQTGAAVLLVATLAACSSPSKPKPAELPPNVAVLAVRQAWSAKLPQVNFGMQPHVLGDTVTVASSDGTVLALDARSGSERWRASVGAPLSAGVGSDGNLTAVVTQKNELVTLRGGKVLWRQPLAAETFTAPLVAGQRVFVQSADRSMSAFDGQSGRRLWTQTRPAENLVLKKPGVLLAVGDTLVTGFGGRLAGLDPANGASRWESPIAAPRGTNDVERLVDLTGTVSRVGDSLCARAYYAAVGCVDTARGSLLWTRPAVGAEGVSGDEQLLVGTEADGHVTAWRRASGERAWQTAALRYRELTGPLLVGRSILLGDSTGLLHVLSREDGSPLNRVSADGSAIVTTPVMAANTVVVVTRNGGVYGFRPE